MSIDHSSALQYGLLLTDAQCREGLRALGFPAGSDPTLADYVEEPFWDLALALGLCWVCVGDAYTPDNVRYVIGPKVMFSNEHASITCDVHGLERLRAFAAQHFPGEELGWSLDTFRS